mmetsp:Transcript_12654/g.21426  ORF Transcript_12654/g.21426 Transcript_12654/m.21426 type:complete len:208 (-) Transcript_12654:591-1214(-)
MGLAKRMSASHQSHRLGVIEALDGELDADLFGAVRGVIGPVGALGVDADRSQQLGVELGQRAGLVHDWDKPAVGEDVVTVGALDIDAARAEPEHGPAQVVDRHVGGQDDQIAPRESPSILVLDLLEKKPRLVLIYVLPHTPLRFEAGPPALTSAPPVERPVRGGAVPRQVDEKGAIRSVIGGPKVLRVHQHGANICLHLLEVDLLKR